MPDHLSVSQVTTYLSCPRKWRFRYIDQLPPEHRSSDLAFGSAIHSAIEWWQNERIEGRLPEERDVLRIFRADWTSETAMGDISYENQSWEEYRDLGEALIGLFTKRFVSMLPVAVEVPFEVPLFEPRSGVELSLPLVGRLDFIGEGIVYEVKTASRKTKASNWSLQLCAYAYAYRCATGRRPEVRVIELLKTKEPAIEVLDFAVTDRDEAWFLEVTAEVLRGIEANTYFPIPSWQCPRCEYRRACRGG